MIEDNGCTPSHYPADIIAIRYKRSLAVVRRISRMG